MKIFYSNTSLYHIIYYIIVENLGTQQVLNEDPTLPSFPNNTNPNTGEVGGPRGPEPTRYGDWERKGRVTDF